MHSLKDDENAVMLIKVMTIMNQPFSSPHFSLFFSLSPTSPSPLSLTFFLSISVYLSLSSPHSFLSPSDSLLPPSLPPFPPLPHNLPLFSFSPPPPVSPLTENERTAKHRVFPLAIDRPNRIMNPDFLPSDRAPISEIQASGERFCHISKRFFII